ncbi:unnamed protein product [Zymoseptoria tritici ST99CH_1E4]|uniref:Uncharacterized protein n=1 Tax=Zymoseptoria tritici ST99CH_1E4 TaxID=1276532 RepID=A0A2H1FY82_ZYMTR|nr:unnamed protein product [Zymoseptoria tritici ST99CH_1E4]
MVSTKVLGVLSLQQHDFIAIMKLINARTLKLESFHDERKLPQYAILSHVWGDKEVQHHHLVAHPSPADDDVNYAKVLDTCRQALIDGIGYAWIDTCCIDKTSSVELSEAINSMWRYYEGSAVCYAYMADVSMRFSDSAPSSVPNSFSPQKADGHAHRLSCGTTEQGRHSEGIVLGFRNIKWFTRGWTLQELLAPLRVVFYTTDWQRIGDQHHTMGEIQGGTSIPEDVLLHAIPLEQIGVAMRMSWAARRVTTRVEDEAYSLLGIFGINMPMLYGEGRNAFARLQESIIRQSQDQSIFAWDGSERQLLAPSPRRFANAAGIIPRVGPARISAPHEITNAGLHITLPAIQDEDWYERYCLALLDCVDLLRPCQCFGIALKRPTMRAGRFCASMTRAGHKLRYISDHSHVSYAEDSSKRTGLAIMAGSLPFLIQPGAMYSSYRRRFQVVLNPEIFDISPSSPKLFPRDRWHRSTLWTEFNEPTLNRAVYDSTAGDWDQFRAIFIPTVSVVGLGLFLFWDVLHQRIGIVLRRCRKDEMETVLHELKYRYSKLSTPRQRTVDRWKGYAVDQLPLERDVKIEKKCWVKVRICEAPVQEMRFARVATLESFQMSRSGRLSMWRKQVKSEAPTILKDLAHSSYQEVRSKVRALRSSRALSCADFAHSSSGSQLHEPTRTSTKH